MLTIRFGEDVYGVDGAWRGLRLECRGDPPPSALRVEACAPLYRISLGLERLLWARFDRHTGHHLDFVWPRGEREPLAIVPPIRADEARRAPRDETARWVHWARYFATRLAASDRSPLATGPWLLRKQSLMRSNMWQRSDDAPDGADTRSGLRILLGETDPRRARVWRKRAREGAIVPALFFQPTCGEGRCVELLLDGHDRHVLGPGLVLVRAGEGTNEQDATWPMHGGADGWLDEVRRELSKRGETSDPILRALSEP